MNDIFDTNNINNFCPDKDNNPMSIEQKCTINMINDHIIQFTLSILKAHKIFFAYFNKPKVIAKYKINEIKRALIRHQLQIPKQAASATSLLCLEKCLD